MNKTIKVSVLAAAIAAALPSWVGAAGLGGINVYSALGQPLRAEIELKATAEELDGMVAVVPGIDAFRKANVPYSPLMQSLKLSIERGTTRPVIRINTDRAVSEPFMDLLVEISWASGRVLREYTFLIDPVEMRPAEPVRAAASGRAASGAALPPSGRQDRHVVRGGETLHRIASNYLPDGAHLEQMLVALLRENEHAFADGNVNRLRAGAALTIPDADTVAAVNVTAARETVRAQTEAFESYRNRVASSVAARPAAAESAPTRQREGRVEPRVEDVVRDPASTDQVQVSGAPATEQTGAAEAPEAGSSQVEDVVALDRAIEERDERIADLEATVRDLQRALELTNATLAKLQAGESSGAPAPREPVVPAPAPKKKAVPPPEPSMMESLTGNPLLLGVGAALIGLLALLGMRVARRRREDREVVAMPGYGAEPTEPTSVVSAPGGQRVDTNTGPSSVLDSDFSQTGLSAIDADEGVDPVAEADVYLAYGRDAQAEEILLDALKVDAARHAIYLKLLEVYVQRGDRRQFEVIASDLYARTGGEGSDWQKAVAMGRKLDPDNPLYGGSGGMTPPEFGTGAIAAGAGAVVAAADSEADEDPISEAFPELPTETRDVAEEADKADTGDAQELGVDMIDFDLDTTPAEAETVAPDDSADSAVKTGSPAPVEVDENMLAFDLDLGDDPATAKDSAASVEPMPEPEPDVQSDESDDAVVEHENEESTFMDLERTEFDANLLDFDLDLSPPEQDQGKSSATQDAAMDLTSIDLDLDMGGGDAAAGPAEAAMPDLAPEDVQREMETKLELARAYDEMGDREGARELLEEVVKEGSPDQREAAELMLERLS